MVEFSFSSSGDGGAERVRNESGKDLLVPDGCVISIGTTSEFGIASKF